MNVVRVNNPQQISTVWIRLELAKLVSKAFLYVSFKTNINPFERDNLDKSFDKSVFSNAQKVRHEKNKLLTRMVGSTIQTMIRSDANMTCTVVLYLFDFGSEHCRST